MRSFSARLLSVCAIAGGVTGARRDGVSGGGADFAAAEERRRPNSRPSREGAGSAAAGGAAVTELERARARRRGSAGGGAAAVAPRRHRAARGGRLVVQEALELGQVVGLLADRVAARALPRVQISHHLHVRVARGADGRRHRERVATERRRRRHPELEDGADLDDEES